MYSQVSTDFSATFEAVHIPAGRMNSKTKIKIYRKVIEEVSKEYEGSNEFIRNKINELCSEHGMSTEEVRLYIFMFVMLCTQFSYAHI